METSDMALQGDETILGLSSPSAEYRQSREENTHSMTVMD